jgi:hypothetical protein
MAPANKPNRVDCWCGENEQATELQCSHCLAWVHYLCTGLSLRKLTLVINEKPALYFCRSCVSLPDYVSERDALISANGSPSFFEYSDAMYRAINVDDDTLLIVPKLDDIAATVKDIKASAHSCGARHLPSASYAQVARQNVPGLPQGLTSGVPGYYKHPPKQVEPKHTLIVEKALDSSQYRDSLALKKRLDDRDPLIAPLISASKVVGNGNIFIELKDDKAMTDAQPMLLAILSDAFGNDAKLRPMVNPIRGPKAVVLRGLPSTYDSTTMESILKDEYHSVSSVIDLSKQGSGAVFKGFKIELNDENEYNRIISYGVRIGFESFRAEPWVRPPRQCYNCQRFSNHIAANCRSNHCCVNCSEQHPRDRSCAKESKCVNCGGHHRSSDSSCPARRQAFQRQFYEAHHHVC